MAKNGLSIRDKKGLKKALAKRSEPKPAMKKIVTYWGTQLQERTIRNAVFVKGYQTGNLRRSITGKIENVPDGYKYVVLSPAEYSYYLEHGTRYMSAQPFMGPAFRSVAPMFEDGIKRIKELSK